MVAPVYDFFLGRRFPDHLARLTKLPVKGLLLDAGGGTGRISIHFHTATRKVVVSDLSFPMLVQAKRKRNLLLVQSCAERLPFEKDTFDRVLVVDALHHFYDQRQAVREIIRVLKPGGRLVIEEPDIHLFAVKIVALLENILKMNSRFLSSQEISSIISDSGLNPRIEKTKNFRTWIIADK